MANLFEISNALSTIYDSIEENGGELSDEMAEQLAISEEDFKSKIKDYSTLIRSIDADIENCKAEEKRIKEYRTHKENLKERLSKIIAEAITKFGDTTKSGGKFCDFGVGKVSVKKTQIVDINKDYVENVGTFLNDFIKKCNDNRLFETGLNLQDNAILAAKQNSIQLDDADLSNLGVSIIFKGNCAEMFADRTKVLALLASIPNASIEYNVSKTDCKKAITGGSVLSYATLVDNSTISIK